MNTDAITNALAQANPGEIKRALNDAITQHVTRQIFEWMTTGVTHVQRSPEGFGFEPIDPEQSATCGAEAFDVERDAEMIAAEMGERVLASMEAALEEAIGLAALSSEGGRA
jgi:hypothetical protein